MRTSIDLPDSLFDRLKACTAKRRVTLRALVIAAIEKELAEDREPFELRDASTGDPANGVVSQEKIERQLAADRDFDFSS